MTGRSQETDTGVRLYLSGDANADTLNVWEAELSLRKKAQENITEDIELHRPYVDDVHLTCPVCGKTMTRIPEVMDCWFDSGDYAFAQQHYPFENKENFDEELFPRRFHMRRNRPDKRMVLLSYGNIDLHRRAKRRIRTYL